MQATLISCDEAGFTGPGLLDEHQPVFAYAAHDLSESESATIVAEIRQKHRIQSPELKSKLLRQRSGWPAIALEIVEKVGDRAAVIAMDKRLSLAAKTFEYIFEPVLADSSTLFYGRDLHRFVMNALHQSLFRSGRDVSDLALELQTFMRSFDPVSAPSLFTPSGSPISSNDPLIDVLAFARGYAQIIERENLHLQRGVSDIGKWALDLTSTCLWSLILRHWEHRHERLDLLCDDSKPLLAMAHVFDNLVGREVEVEIPGPTGPVTLKANLAHPMRFGSSSNHCSIQIADILAGATADVIRKDEEKDFKQLGAAISPLLHEDSVLPDPAICDIRSIPAFLNRLALRQLAQRAVQGAHPYQDMDSFYEAMEAQLRAHLAGLRS